MSDRDALIEFVARLFDANKLAFGHAARLAQISEEQLESELERRGIPRYRYTAEHLAQDLEALRGIEAGQKAGT